MWWTHVPVLKHCCALTFLNEILRKYTCTVWRYCKQQRIFNIFTLLWGHMPFETCWILLYITVLPQWDSRTRISILVFYTHRLRCFTLIDFEANTKPAMSDGFFFLSRLQDAVLDGGLGYLATITFETLVCQWAHLFKLAVLSDQVNSQHYPELTEYLHINPKYNEAAYGKSNSRANKCFQQLIIFFIMKIWSIWDHTGQLNG